MAGFSHVSGAFAMSGFFASGLWMYFYVLMILFGIAGAWLGHVYRNRMVGGLLLGTLLSGIGLILIAAIPDDRRKCPQCHGAIPESATRCRHCGEVVPA